MNITFVTGNKFKAEETKRIINTPLNIKDIDLDEIQEVDIQKVALHKLNQAYEVVNRPVIIDDVSFEIDAWNKFPGPLVKWILNAGGPELILKMLGDEKNRVATAKLAVGYKDDNVSRIFIGEVKGKVGFEVKGKNGFGWDKVFIPDGYDKTFAQMDPSEKDQISHRGKALGKLSDFLNSV